MAEVEKADLRKNVESTPSSPDSTAAGANGLKAAKDRTCPFCKQAFTSSSLGRHLDLYIKPRNPKPPDGVHNVDEIRKIRGAITRRQPRTSLKAPGLGGEEERDKKGGEAWAGSPLETRPVQADTARALHDIQDSATCFNAAPWQATGVINNLPPREQLSRTSSRTPVAQGTHAHEQRRHDPAHRAQPPERPGEELAKLQDAAEVGRAAEMALRELLASLEAAKKKAEPQKLFEEFDFCALAFPGLCLAMLPPPPAIFSSTPFAVAHTWSLSPPGESQRSAMVRVLYERFNALRNANPDAVPESHMFQYRVHMDGAFEHWQTLSDAEQAASWTLELARAFSKERDRTQGLKRDLELAQQRARHLEAEYDRISRCQLPREYLLHPPNTVPMPPAVLKELKSNALPPYAAELDYDPDTLLERFKATIRATARPPRTPAKQAHHVDRQRNALKTDMFLNGMVIGVNGSWPREREHAQPGSATGYPASQMVTSVNSPSGEVEEVQRLPFEDHAAQGILVKLRNGNDSPAVADAGLNPRGNGNGKRPLSPHSFSAESGKRSMPKVYREQPP